MRRYPQSTGTASVHLSANSRICRTLVQVAGSVQHQPSSINSSNWTTGEKKKKKKKDGTAAPGPRRGPSPFVCPLPRPQHRLCALHLRCNDPIASLHAKSSVPQSHLTAPVLSNSNLQLLLPPRLVCLVCLVWSRLPSRPGLDLTACLADRRPFSICIRRHFLAGCVSNLSAHLSASSTLLTRAKGKERRAKEGRERRQKKKKHKGTSD